MKRALSYLLVLLVCSATAQTVRVLNLKSGLSNNYVECMLQDQQGYIWIGTRDGLNRFDGYRVETFRENLPSAFVYSLFQDSSGIIWIGTSQGGVTTYDPKLEQFKVLRDPPFSILQNKDVFTIREDRNKNVWLGTLQGLAMIPAHRDTLLWYEEQGGSLSFTALHFDTNGEFFAGTNKGLYTVTQTGSKLSVKSYPAPGLTPYFIRDMLESPSGIFWFATDNEGVIRFDRKRNTLDHVVASPAILHQQVWKLFQDSHGIIYAAVISGGIYELEKDHRLERSQENISKVFNGNSITGLVEDNSGNLWISSHGDGVCYFNPRKYVFERHFDGAGDKSKHPTVVSSFYEDVSGLMWIGTDGDGLKKLNTRGETIQSLTTANGLSSNIILDIVEDAQHAKWLATWQGGVDKIDASGKITAYNGEAKGKFDLKNTNVKALMRDSLSNIWMASHGGGIAVFNTNEKQFMDPHEILPALIPAPVQWGSDMLHARNGDTWFATHAGLFRHTANSFLQYHADGHPGSIASALVYCVFEDSKGNIWIGTSASLEKFDRKKNTFENYSLKYHLPGNVKCIQEDNHGNLWMSTVTEIISFNENTGEVRHFDESYNTQQGQFYECSCMKTKAGKLYFGGTEGYNSFWPDSVKDDRLSSPILITGLYLFNKKQHPADSSVLKQSLSFTNYLELPYDENVIGLEFLSLNYSAFNNSLYTYKLEGFNTDWSPLSLSRMATYTNLDPGEYTFKVRAMSVNHIIVSESQLRIKIVPPFWKTWWFRGFVIMVVLAAIVGYLLLRLYSSKQKRLMLQRLVEERTQEVQQKNLMLEQQKAYLEKTNEALVDQQKMITQQSQTLSEQRDQLQKNNLDLLDLNATKDRLFSIIAHDLRNPFTSLLGFSRLLNTEFARYSDEERQKLIRSLYHSSSSIYSLLDNLLMWSKSQQQILAFSPEKIPFSRIVSELFDLFEDEAGKKDVKLKLGHESDVVFLADRNMLSIILRNLLSNALRHSPIHGEIEVDFTVKDHILEIFVKDEGSGISSDVELFNVNSDAVRNRDHNHGLGLILCREFAEKHGGTIRAFNNSGKGACFAFTLPESNPMVTADTHTYSSDKMLHVPEQTHDASQYSDVPLVLIAEDDDDIRWYIRQILFPEFKVLEAVNGVEAIQLAEENVPALIISDLVMPGSDGLVFCEKVKSHPQTSHIPFIMLTAERSSDKKISGFQFGADDYLTKPVNSNVLRARVHNLIESRVKLKAVYQRDITAEPETFAANTIDQEFFEKLNATIIKKIADSELNPDTLAREMCMSRTGLYMKIKALTGESVGIYIRNIRLKESKKLLLNRKINISEVAYAVGFNQLSYFTTCFREAFGTTPTDFLASHSSVVGKR